MSYSGKQLITPDGTRIAPIGYDRNARKSKPRVSVSLNKPNGLDLDQGSVTSAREIFIRSVNESPLGSSQYIPIRKSNFAPRQSVFKKTPKCPGCPDKPPPKFLLWCFKKDYGICINLFWFLVGTAIVFSVLAIFGLLIAKVVRQQDANVNAYFGQTGKFVGEYCNSSRECTTQAVCVSGTCQCVVDMYYDQFYGKCLPLKSYREGCLETRECSQFVGLVCVDSFCDCPIQTVWGNYYGRQECIRTREVGETCTSTSHCVGNSFCALVSGTTTYRCSCLSTQFLSGVTGQCETIRKVNERCYNWYQECPSYTTCRPNNNGDGTYFCQCIEGTYYDGKTQSCIKTQSINGNCNETVNCNTIPGLYCYSGKCICPNNQFWNGTYCQYYSSYGRPCSSSQLCSQGDPNLICGIPPGGVVQQMCYCNTNYYFDEYLQQCVRFKSEGSICYDSSECVDNATCINKVCTCYPGYWSNPRTGECDYELAYNDTCSTNSTAKLCNNLEYGINCFNNTCTCHPTNEYWNGSSCQLRRQYGEACTNIDLCATYRGLACNSATSGTCVCASGRSYSSTYYWCI